ncbi:hypothetical protein ACFQ0B_47225 [Nonomuraea thailandensis]
MKLGSQRDQCLAFRRHYARQDAPAKNGHLILVTGQEKHGKTSLLGWCAAYLRRKGAPRDHHRRHLTVQSAIDSVLFADLSPFTFDSADDRVRFQKLVQILQAGGTRLPLDISSTRESEDHYRVLAHYMQKGLDCHLLIQLPPMDTMEQIRSHLWNAWPGITFLAETSPILYADLEKNTGGEPKELSTYLYEKVQDTAFSTFMHLHAGPLQDDEFVSYVRERLRISNCTVHVDDDLISEFHEHRRDIVGIGHWRSIFREIFDLPNLTALEREHFNTFSLGGTWPVSAQSKIDAE